MKTNPPLVPANTFQILQADWIIVIWARGRQKWATSSFTIRFSHQLGRWKRIPPCFARGDSFSSTQLMRETYEKWMGRYVFSTPKPSNQSPGLRQIQIHLLVSNYLFILQIVISHQLGWWKRIPPCYYITGSFSLNWTFFNERIIEGKGVGRIHGFEY